MEPKPETLTLPLVVVSRVDVGKLQRELEALDAFLTQAAIRQPGTSLTMPRTTRTLDDFARQNNLNLINTDDRKRLKQFLDEVKDNAPTIQMSFAADPPAAFVAKVIKWLRQEIHPLLLLQTGLQPGIAAGCVLRTPNRYFDLSLRRYFKQQRDLLITKIEGK